MAKIRHMGRSFIFSILLFVAASITSLRRANANQAVAAPGDTALGVVVTAP